MKTKAVFFDLDGTLLDTLESIATAGNHALTALGLTPLPIENYKYYAGDGADTLCRRMLADCGDMEGVRFSECFRIYSEYFKTDCTYHVKPFDGILPLLKELEHRKIQTAVISNKPHERTLDVVSAQFGIHKFSIVLGNQKDQPKKPDPSSALLAAKKLGVLPEECLFVGDTNVDMQTGINAHMRSIGVLWGFRDREELLANHAYGIIESPLELLKYCSRL